MKNFNTEMIEKAKAAKSAEELLEIAKANGVEMTEEDAKTYFAQLVPPSGEIDDDDLDNVAGGACGGSVRAGDDVRVTSGETCQICGGNTGTVKSVGAFGVGAVVCHNCSDSIIAYVGSATLEKI
jgi:predicted ribosomally synthesized peptide with nif11-like leader